MLHKLMIHIALLFLFAFTQIGVATHEISHFSNATQQTHPDQHTSPDQCSQCLAHADAAAGVLMPAFSMPLLLAALELATAPTQHASSTTLAYYSARAPPTSLN